MPSLRRVRPACGFQHVAPFPSPSTWQMSCCCGFPCAEQVSGRLHPEISILSGRQSNLKFNHLSPKRAYLIIAFLEERAGPGINLQNLGMKVEGGVCQAMAPRPPCWRSFFSGQEVILLGTTIVTISGWSSPSCAGQSQRRGQARRPVGTPGRAPVQERFPHSAGRPAPPLLRVHRPGERVSKPVSAGSQGRPRHPGPQLVSDEA